VGVEGGVDWLKSSSKQMKCQLMQWKAKFRKLQPKEVNQRKSIEANSMQ
jgi:hypothetical protein